MPEVMEVDDIVAEVMGVEVILGVIVGATATAVMTGVMTMGVMLPARAMLFRVLPPCLGLRFPLRVVVAGTATAG